MTNGTYTGPLKRVFEIVQAVWYTQCYFNTIDEHGLCVNKYFPIYSNLILKICKYFLEFSKGFSFIETKNAQ